LRGHAREPVEVAAVAAAYIFVLIVGLCTQAAGTFDSVNVEVLGPPDGMQFQTSPVELAAIITSQTGTLPNAHTRIIVLSLATGETEELAGTSGEDGIVRVLFPAHSGNYSWYVAADIEGYPTIVSRPRSFSTRLALIVDCLHPCSSGPPLLIRKRNLDLQVMITDTDGNPVESANVTFYVNSTIVYHANSDLRGVATLFWNRIPPGTYTWFAIASKDGAFGASRLSTFVVKHD
jgi:hypothetical protein